MHENERQILSEHHRSTLEHLESPLQSGGLRPIGRGYPAPAG
ncbi:hypothetical protein ACU4GD_30675 [Cupriavidus basilensis]